jgi:hypothetical protein
MGSEMKSKKSANLQRSEQGLRPSRPLKFAKERSRSRLGRSYGRSRAVVLRLEFLPHLESDSRQIQHARRALSRS